jgi:hypothetical protein
VKIVVRANRCQRTPLSETIGVRTPLSEKIGVRGHHCQKKIVVREHHCRKKSVSANTIVRKNRCQGTPREIDVRGHHCRKKSVSPNTIVRNNRCHQTLLSEHNGFLRTFLGLPKPILGITVRENLLVFLGYFRLGSHQMYGHIRCLYAVLDNPGLQGFMSNCMTSPSSYVNIILQACIICRVGQNHIYTVYIR